MSALIGCEWDKDGEMLAVLQKRCEQISLLDVNTREIRWLELHFSLPCFMRWSKIGTQVCFLFFFVSSKHQNSSQPAATQVRNVISLSPILAVFV